MTENIDVDKFTGGYLSPETVQLGMRVGKETYMDENSGGDVISATVIGIADNQYCVTILWDDGGRAYELPGDLWAYPAQFEEEEENTE